MKYFLKIEVGLQPGYSDPESETTARLLKELGYEVEAVKTSKVYGVIISALSKQEARGKAIEICQRLLANPTKDKYEIEVKEEK